MRTIEEMKADIVRWNKNAPTGYVWAVNAPRCDSNGQPNDTAKVLHTTARGFDIPPDDIIVLKDVDPDFKYSVFIRDKWAERAENLHISAMESAIEESKVIGKLLSEIDGLINKLEWKEANSEQAEGRFNRIKES